MSKYYYNLGLFFEDVVNNYGSNIAISYKKKSYSYSELNELANKFCSLLMQHNIVQGDVIVIANTKEINSFALMLACIKMGIIYVNIDIEGPKKRLEKIFQTCTPKIVFSDEESHIVKEASENLSILFLSLSNNLVRKIKSIELSIQKIIKNIDGSSIVYIMFTSGSTGIPKGAAITHQNLIHFINWSHSFYEINDKEIFANVSPFYFDNSVFDFFTSLFSGSCLVPIKRDIITNPHLLVQYVDDFKCTVWFSVPSMLMYLMNMKSLNRERFQFIRVIAFGGEGYPKKELIKLFKLFKYKAKIINVYGPTECACICSAYIIKSSDFNDLNGLPCLGQLNQNFNYLILDQNSKVNMEGELCLIGPNVGAGYYNDPKRTKKAFINIDNGAFYSKKMFKTGDIVREENGMLYFKCRKDNQIKHMGYRIELEEIETNLNLIQGVKQSVVIYKKNNSVFGKIIAFISVDAKIDKKFIEEELKMSIPLYMFPNKINILDSMPLNSNGKIDKNALSIIE